MPMSPLLGERIRQVRKGRHISLSQLSRGTGLSISFLSRLESQKVNVSVDNLNKIAGFLAVNITRFFEPKPLPFLGAITRKGKGIKVKFRSTQGESLITRCDANIQATLYTNPSGKGRKLPFSHSGEEFVYVIRGEVLFILGKQKYHLNAGDCMYYRSEATHRWVNTGNHDSSILIFNSPQVW